MNVLTRKNGFPCHMYVLSTILYATSQSAYNAGHGFALFTPVVIRFIPLVKANLIIQQTNMETMLVFATQAQDSLPTCIS